MCWTTPVRTFCQTLNLVPNVWWCVVALHHSLDSKEFWTHDLALRQHRTGIFCNENVHAIWFAFIEWERVGLTHNNWFHRLWWPAHDNQLHCPMNRHHIVASEYRWKAGSCCVAIHFCINRPDFDCSWPPLQFHFRTDAWIIASESWHQQCRPPETSSISRVSFSTPFQITHLKFIEADEPTVSGNHISNRFGRIEGICFIAADEIQIFRLLQFHFVYARMNIGHERIEMDSFLLINLTHERRESSKIILERKRFDIT